MTMADPGGPGELTTAARMFREMDMRVWLKQAQDEMSSLT